MVPSAIHPQALQAAPAACASFICCRVATFPLYFAHWAAAPAFVTFPFTMYTCAWPADIPVLGGENALVSLLKRESDVVEDPAANVPEPTLALLARIAAAFCSGVISGVTIAAFRAEAFWSPLIPGVIG